MTQIKSNKKHISKTQASIQNSNNILLISLFTRHKHNYTEPTHLCKITKQTNILYFYTPNKNIQTMHWSLVNVYKKLILYSIKIF